MTITRIERQKRDSHRVNIYIDGEFSFGIQDDVLVKFGLRKGDTLTKEQLDTISSEEEEARAKQQSLRFISYRMRSEKEIRRKLTEKEFPPDVITRTVDRLRTLGLVNDLEFARLFVHDQQLRRPSGKRLLTQKLRMKGITTAIIHCVLSETTGPEEEHSAALEAARKQMKRRKTPRDKAARLKEQQRVARFLAQRGYEWSTISPVLRTLFKSESIAREEY